MIDIKQILYEITQNEAVFDEDLDLLEAEILDSFAIITLLNCLEDKGIVLRINKASSKLFRTSKGIQQLVDEAIGTVDC